MYDDGPDAEGAGAGAVLAVLAPVLAGIAALLFLLIGYVMRSVGSSEAVAGPMITVGWWFGGLTAAGVLIAMTGILLTALRNGRAGRGRTTRRAPGRGGRGRPGAGGMAARAAGARRAPLPPGSPRQCPGRITEFLRPPGPPAGHSRTPTWATPAQVSAAPTRNPPPTRTGYTSPDFTSPDFDGSDNRPR
ncbi:hypothetical protein GCM10020000_39830 [Streptomyces olivoverticillatus]